MAGLRHRLRAFAETLTSGASTTVDGGGPRAAGPPRSSNGASSFHLIWDMPRTAEAARLVEMSAVLEVVAPPRVASLYFWALQVDFEEDGRNWGGGHTGLQWNRRFPGNTAVNWGGYAAPERGGAVLPGSQPDLFAFPGDPNTMAFDWSPQRPYRLRVFRSPDVSGAWRADVTDVATGRTTVIRDLMHPDGPRERSGGGRRAGAGGYLSRPLVWSEVFADCDAPSVAVRWSDLSATNEDGVIVRPRAVRVNYQAHQDGGCSNTSVRRDGAGLLQMTNTPREIHQGSAVELGPA
jgi:hypothetical protein